MLFLLTLLPLAVIGIVNNGETIKEGLANRRATKLAKQSAAGAAPAEAAEPNAEAAETKELVR